MKIGIVEDCHKNELLYILYYSLSCVDEFSKHVQDTVKTECTATAIFFLLCSGQRTLPNKIIKTFFPNFRS